jgi:hypothetical protein
VQECKDIVLPKISKGSTSLQYGEIEFWSFLEVLKFINPNSEDIFIDLGSGIGKAVILAALCFEMKELIGIEIVSELDSLANQLFTASVNRSSRLSKPKIQFMLDDIFTSANIWSRGTIIFISTTCFTAKMLDEIARLFESSLAAGTRVISLSAQIPSQKFSIIHSHKYRMSWGNATVFIQIKN